MSRKQRRGGVWVEQVLPVAVLALALLVAPLMIFSSEGLPRLRGVEKELSTVEQENLELKREIQVLRARVSLLRDDPAAIEQLARAELGLVRQSEVVFQFPKRR
ncbi:MAG: septum formation initiator family protein [Deltaproteobacteria bacterium]|jgi:cell division protein FtsB|nr:septum formation initiator family protein [Deltaproteobacteria bacterium]MBW2536763.1 septum formation initiator family protein [Deltaproteobacteria bacterium]